MRAERLELGTEQEITAGPAVVERLLAEAVADQAERALLAVPQREGEHADAQVQRSPQPPCCDGLKKGLDVRMAAPAVLRRAPLTLERRSQVRMVVDLAVE